MNKVSKLFKTKRPFIGVVHFTPLLGYKDFQGLDNTLKKALKDLKALEDGGVDGLFVENNYDYPHKIIVGPETVACMTFLTQEIVKNTKLPVGVSVLWNDYKAALSISKVTGAKFIRIPVFVDTAKTNYGTVKGQAKDVLAYRKSIEAEDVLLFTDIHVKHAQILSKKTISQSAKEAIKYMADALIITGKWTGDAPNIDDLKKTRKSVGNFPILIGSGASSQNIDKLLEYADGAIVSTSLKTEKTKDKVNIRGFEDSIDKKKVQTFTRVFQTLN